MRVIEDFVIDSRADHEAVNASLNRTGEIAMSNQWEVLFEGNTDEINEQSVDRPSAIDLDVESAIQNDVVDLRKLAVDFADRYGRVRISISGGLVHLPGDDTRTVLDGYDIKIRKALPVDYVTDEM